ncbi:MAG: SDR family oxidoreductase [Devosia sp.]|uniref:SDR family oxidoreductase n=1 Tax=Devosia sp. TaxID=1871048 RepID=UPI001AC2A1DC|nr:SDR family oxidoreductase [Devosia sp.]MBN9317583.1 SDR family oxidoreductase [Devosia sp.]
MGVFFFGMGYSSRATARALHQLRDPDIPISGTTRSEEGAEAFADTNYRIHIFDGEVRGATLGPDLRKATHVILSIPPDERGDPALLHHRADLDAAQNLEWIGYFSTVGVYGDFGGQWVDEDAPTRPVNVRSQQRVEAEQAWRDYAGARGVPLFIERLAGIYGPGRSAFDKLREGTARRIVKPGQVFNRVHVADIGRITALAALAKLEGTYNLADAEPAPPQDLVTYAAQMMGIAPPPEIPFETAQMTEMARSFYSDNKRVSSKRVLAALGTELEFPTYREGLDAIWKAHA